MNSSLSGEIELAVPTILVPSDPLSGSVWLSSAAVRLQKWLRG